MVKQNKADQTQDDKSSAVEQSPEEKILEVKRASETKERLPQENANVLREEFFTSLSVKRETEAGDGTDVLEKSKMTSSSITRSKISITETDEPSEAQQFEGTIETEYLSPSGDGVNITDITTSSLSVCTQYEQCTELNTQSAQVSSLQCRNCNSSEDKSASCSDLCSFCTATTNSPLRPRIPQSLENPVKNQNIDTQLEVVSQSEEETQDTVIVSGVKEPEKLPNNSSCPSTGSSPNASSPSPEVNQPQRDSIENGETHQDQRRKNRRPCNSVCNCNCACRLSPFQIIIGVLMPAIILVRVMFLLISFTLSLRSSSFQKSSKSPPSEAPRLN